MTEDYTDDDYKCYLLGCRSAGVEPMEESLFRVLQQWRFQLQQEEPSRDVAEADQEPNRPRVPPFVLERLAVLMAEGYKIAAGGAEDDEPGAAACGVREPRVPLEPVLVGCAARALPMPDAPDEAFWRI